MMMRALAGSLAGMAAIAAAAWAGPLDKRVVAPGAQWVVHIDVEAIRGSTLCQFVLEHKREEAEKATAELKEELGLDPLRDLKGVTIYGASPEPGECVAVIRATDAVDAVLTKLVEEKKEVRRIDEGGHTLYTWSEGDEERHGYIMRGPGAGDRTVVTAATRERLMAAIRQVEAPAAPAPGEATQGALAKSPRPGSMVFVVGTSMDGLRNAEASMVLQKAQSVVFDAGEAAGEVFADLSLATSSTEEATNMLMVAQGGLGLARMYSQKDPELKDLAAAFDHVKLETEGATVRAKVSFSSRQMREFLVSAAEAAEARRKAADAGGTEKKDEAPAEKPPKKRDN